MRGRRALAGLSLALLAAGLTAWGQEPRKSGLKDLPPRYRDWLEREVVYIIGEKERAVFLQLGTDREREIFIEAFWKQRDPVPETPVNEFKEEHYRRIAFANQQFSRDTTRPGWMTDRGRIHILLGPPLDISRYEGESSIYPTQVWSYAGRPEDGLPPHFDIVFFRRRGMGEYVLFSPAQDGPMGLLVGFRGDPTGVAAAYEQLRKINARLAEVSLSLIPGEGPLPGQPSLASESLIGRVFGLPERSVDSRYAESLLKFKDLIDVEYTANYIGNDNVVSVIRDPRGGFFVHYAVQPEKLSVWPHDGRYGVKFEVNGIVKEADGGTVFQYDKSFLLDFSAGQIEEVRKTGILIEDAFPLISGRYAFLLLMKNTLSKEFTSFEKEIVVPDDAAPRFGMGPLLLGYRAGPAPDGPPQVKPFRAGDVQISCQPDWTFSAKESLAVFFQVFRVPEEMRRSGRVEFVFERQGLEFSRSEVPLGELPAMDILREFPLGAFPPDYYRLDVSLVDGEDRVAVSSHANFIVSPLAEVPRPWVVAKVMPPAGHPIYAYVTGGQLAKSGDLDRAADLLAEAHQAEPNMLDYALAYAEVQIRRRDLEKAAAALLPFAKDRGKNQEALALLGTCYQGLGRLREAATCYRTYLERAGTRLDVLNALGQCLFELGDLKEAAAAWKRSLEIDPDQDDIRERLGRIKQDGGPAAAGLTSRTAGG
jgi:GWxTD domain-containing protein